MDERKDAETQFFLFIYYGTHVVVYPYGLTVLCHASGGDEEGGYEK